MTPRRNRAQELRVLLGWSVRPREDSAGELTLAMAIAKSSRKEGIEE